MSPHPDFKLKVRTDGKFVEHGDSKKARDKLRKQFKDKTVRARTMRCASLTSLQHYYSVFRAGNFIGLGLPAAVLGVVLGTYVTCRRKA